MAGRRNWLLRCGVRTRHGDHAPCRMKPVLNEDGSIRNGRCRFHAGCSTGPRTREGHDRCTEGRKALYGRRRAAGLPALPKRKKRPEPDTRPDGTLPLSRERFVWETPEERKARIMRELDERWPGWRDTAA